MALKLPVWNASKSLKIFGITLLAIGAGVLCLDSTYACGSLSLPTTHFEGVSESGYVSHWDQIGSLDLGDVQVPLNMGFQTYLPYSSPELGAGWVLPLMDANIVQKDANNFLMLQPDGWLGPYMRDGSNPNILHGPGGAIAEIKDNTITVSYSCSASWKMVFTNGKLTSLSKRDHVLSIIRDDQGRGIAIKDGPKIVMTLEQDQKTGLAKCIAMGDSKYQLSYDAKPRIETIKGVNLVGGVDQSLHQLGYPDGRSQTFDFAVTQQLLPDLKITDTEGKERLIIWDTSNHILQDGEWNYGVIPDQQGSGYAAISRTNTTGQTEFWKVDPDKGEEISQTADGKKTIETRFTSGLLTGKIKKLEEILSNGKKEMLNEFAYDENGQILRSSISGVSIFYSEDVSKFKNHLTDNSTAIQKNKNGEIERVLSSSFDTKITKKGSEEVITTMTSSGTLTRVLDAQGRLMSIVSTQQ